MEDSSQADFRELERLITDKGLLKKQSAYYVHKTFVTFALLVASLAIIIFMENFWLRFLNALLLAPLVYGQFSFLGHDSGHKQIFSSNRMNDIFGLVMSFSLGMDRTWWVDKHNRHHGSPNQVGLDPDINFYVLSFTEEDALTKKGIWRQIIKRQAWLLPIMLFFVCVTLRVAGVQYMLSGKRLKFSFWEPFLMLLHFLIYFVFLFSFLGWQAFWFIAVHQLVFGFYMGSVFATNHKGMPILERDSELDYLTKQVITARNVKSNPVVDFMYGGLNYQIEHHLFPRMARNRLGEAQKIVKDFCVEHGIPYHETGFLLSYKEILQYFHRISAVLRRPKPARST